MSGPSLDQYPGFFPGAKRPFWSRAKVGTGAGLAGLLLGIGIGASNEAPVSAESPEVKALVSAGVDERTSTFDDQAEQLQADLDQAHKDADAAAADARETLAATKRAAAQAKRKAVAAAVAAEKAKHAVPPPTYGLTSSGSSSSNSGGGSTSGGSDPLFGTCGEANAHGYGPYQKGVDPEYDHYIDRDGDGRDCEP